MCVEVFGKENDELSVGHVGELQILRHYPKAGQWSTGLEYSETMGCIGFKVFEEAMLKVFLKLSRQVILPGKNYEKRTKNSSVSMVCPRYTEFNPFLYCSSFFSQFLHLFQFHYFILKGIFSFQSLYACSSWPLKSKILNKRFHIMFLLPYCITFFQALPFIAVCGMWHGMDCNYRHQEQQHEV